jgi:hypothetical protein
MTLGKFHGLGNRLEILIAEIITALGLLEIS